MRSADNRDGGIVRKKEDAVQAEAVEVRGGGFNVPAAPDVPVELEVVESEKAEVNDDE